MNALIADNNMRSLDERFDDEGKYKALPDPIHAQRTDEIERAVEALLFGTQHREVGASWTCAVGKGDNPSAKPTVPPPQQSWFVRTLRNRNHD